MRKRTGGLSGRMEGKALRSMVFPEPGGPMIMVWWKPAAAISRHRLASNWALISLKSNALALGVDMDIGMDEGVSFSWKGMERLISISFLENEGV